MQPKSQAPVDYRCHLLDSHGRIVWRHRFRAASDEEAVAAARSFLRDRIDSTVVFELWQEQRFIAGENDALIVELAAAPDLVLPAAL